MLFVFGSGVGGGSFLDFRLTQILTSFIQRISRFFSRCSIFDFSAFDILKLWYPLPFGSSFAGL